MRQFVCSRMPDSEGAIALSAKEFRYLSRVLRLSEGSSIDVRLPGGSLIQMKLCTDKTENVLKAEKLPARENIGSPCTADMPLFPPAGPEFWLFQFLPKAPKADLIVRQAAECGISRIVAIRGEYSPPYTPRIERWQRIIREARQQSGSPVETKITDVLSAKEAAALWKKTTENTAAAAFILCEREEGQKSIFSHIRHIAAVKEEKKDAGGIPFAYTAFAAGCEGGISRNERNLLEQNGFVPIHFKTNILRAETAALYGFAAIQSAVTEYKAWKSNE
ncbi:RsmE family RNA methyltransferase [Treponema sp. HNW]|uniref:RsmE family RNA methyltransferase n=1 Tax=Treponema sp. HNW TaxID=3116654 RepID=UPI003D10461A